MNIPKRKDSRLIIIYHKDGEFTKDAFAIILETIGLGDFGRLLFTQKEEFSAQLFIDVINLPRTLKYLSTVRHIGIRHRTFKLTQKRYDRIISELKEVIINE